MSYQVIARKYRPQRFSEVVGQDHVAQTLANAIAQNRIAHAYLFCGPRGTGKTTIARIFAKCLNCTGGPKVDFADDDPRAKEITEGRSLDVIEIDGASNRGIEEIRELRETVRFAPASSRFKIFIIDEVHMLTKEAFNALLKTLEEPPAHAKFMFATTEPEKVLPTILSRCQRFDLRRIPTALIVSHLDGIARQEGIKADQKALLAVARGADGGMRDAESTLDQLISFCGSTIEEADVLAMYGLTAQDQVQRLTAAILGSDAPAILAELDQLAKQGKDLSRLLTDLLSHIRNVLVFQASGGRQDLLDISEIEASGLKSLSSLASQEVLSRALDILAATEARMRDAGSKRIVLEVGLLKAAQATRVVPIDQILVQLQSLRSQWGSAPSEAAAEPPLRRAPVPVVPIPQPVPRVSAPPATPTPPPQVELPPPPPSPQPGAPSDLAHLWHGLLDAVGRVSAFARSYLIEAHPVSFEKQVLTIGFEKEFAEHIALVDNAKNRAVLQTKLAEAGHRDCQVRFIQAERPEAWARSSSVAQAEPLPGAEVPPAKPAALSVNPAKSPPALNAAPAKAKPSPPPPTPTLNAEDYKNDPLIKQALEIFKGQIVEVRG